MAPRPVGAPGRRPLLYAVAGAIALAVGVLVALSPITAAALAFVPLLVLNLNNPRSFIVLAGLALPLTPVLVFPVGSVVVPVVDIVAMVAIGVMLLDPGRKPIGKAPLTALALAAPYLLVAVWVSRPEAHNHGDLLTVVQRAELLLVWTVFGAMVFLGGWLRMFLTAFLISSGAVALAWMTAIGQGAVFGMQKNASGGYMATALVVALLVRMPSRFRVGLSMLLLAGLFASGSRGALLGAAIASVVIGLSFSQWKRLVAPGLALMAVVVVALSTLPPAVVDRLLSRSDDGRRNVEIRSVFVRDALLQYHAHPHGVGVGGYRQILRQLQQVQTYDPHNAWALALVEGGRPLLGAFIVLTAGSLLLAFWAARRHWVGLLAFAVQIAVYVHVYVDVYWVRGTPALGVMLIGASSAVLWRQRAARSAVAVDADASCSVVVERQLRLAP